MKQTKIKRCQKYTGEYARTHLTRKHWLDQVKHAGPLREDDALGVGALVAECAQLAHQHVDLCAALDGAAAVTLSNVKKK